MNQLLSPQIIARETLKITVNNLAFVGAVNKDYEAEFSGSYNGNKPGQSILIRRPVRFQTRLGRVAVPQDIIENNTVLAVTEQVGVDFQWTSADMALTIDQWKQRYGNSAGIQIANGIDQYCFAKAVNQTANSVGTAGTVPTDLTPFTNAMAKLDKLAVPRAGRRVIMEPLTNASLVNNLKGLFNPSSTISQQYLKGEVTSGTLGMAWEMDQNAPVQTYGLQGGTPVVNGASQSGTTLITNGWTASRQVINAGDVFTITGVYAVNPVNKTSTGQLAQFVATTNVVSDGSGNATIAIGQNVMLSGPYQNVTNLPANGAAINLYAPAGTVSNQNLVFHPDAYTFASVKLDVPGNTDMGYTAVDPQTGIALRFTRSWDNINDVWLSRYDTLFGFTTTRDEFAVRVQA